MLEWNLFFFSVTVGPGIDGRHFRPSHMFTFIDLGLIRLKRLTENAGKLIPGNTLTIQLRITVSNSKKESTTSLVKDLASMYNDKEFSDMRIICGSEVFHVHKFMLCARSPVFKGILSHENLETREGKIVIPNTHHTLVSAMLKYMYTNKVEKIEEVAAELISLADMYQLLELKIMCEDALGLMLNVENVLDYLILADRFGASQLKSLCMEFIIEHKKEVKDSTPWKETMADNPQLWLEVCEKLFDN